MSRVVTIDVEARFVDNITDESKAASKSVEGIGKSADKAQKQVDNLSKKKAKPIFDADDNKFLKKIRSMEDKMRKMGRTKTAAVLDVVDKATNKIGKILNKAQSFGRKTWQGILKLKDSDALGSIKKVTSGLENITKKTWQGMVKIKDMALAPIKAIKNALFSIPTLITAVVSAKIVQTAVLEPINLADQYTSAQIGFETLLGDSRAKQMMNEIDIFAKATPFKTSNVISNVQKMMAYGWDVERVIDDMETIGDAAAATGKGDQGLESIVRALAEIRSKGKLSTQELNQLAGAGIKAKMYLAQGLGYGTSDAGLMKLAEDLEDGAIGANKAIELILQGMQEFDGMMDKTANETVEGLKSQLEDVFEINIARRWGQGLQDGARKGLGTIVSLLGDAEESLSAVGDTLYELGKVAADWVAEKLEKAAERIKTITDSYEFKNASVGEKVSMLWNGVVADPIKEWWNNGGKEKVIDTATDVGKAIGKAILEGISVAWNALPWWGKLLVGGYAAGKAVSGIGNVVGGVSNLIGALGSTGGFVQAGAAGLMKVPGTGLLGGLSKVGYSMLGTSGVGVGGGMAALAGGATIAGFAGMAAGAIKGLKDLAYDAPKAFKEGNKRKAWGQVASGGTVLTATGAGAAIGSIFGPIGTAVGGGIGAFGGWLLGDYFARKIEASKYEHEGLKEKIAEGADEAEILAEHEKALWENAKKHFGQIKLTTAEIQRLSDQIVWGDDLEYFENFSSAANSAKSSLESMKSTSQEINKWMWKASLGVKFNNDEQKSFIESIDSYINSSKSLLENKHYQFAASVSLLLDPESETGKSIIKKGNSYYAEQQEEIDKLTKELANKVQSALEDGVISTEKITLPDGTLQLSEQEEIQNLQKQIASIIEQTADEKFKADLEVLKIKWGSVKMDEESFDSFVETLGADLGEKIAALDEALAYNISESAKIFGEGSDEYKDAVENYANGYATKVVEAKVAAIDAALSTLGGAFTGELGSNAAEDLHNALENALSEGIEPVEITDEQLAKWLDVKGELEGATADNIRNKLQAILDTIVLDVNLERALVTGMSPEEWKKAYKNFLEKNGLGIIETKVDVKAEPVVEADGKTLKLLTLPETYGIQPSYPIETKLNITATKGTVSPLTIGPNGLVNLTSNTVSPTINFSPKIGNVSPLSLDKYLRPWQKYRGGIVGGTSAAEQFALGGRPTDGMLKGSTRFISVNEESPEMIIPLSSQRRARAMKLWTKTGNLLGVPGFARGGMTAGGQDEGLRFQSYGSGDSVGGQSVQIDIGGLTFEINVNGNDAQSITTAIKEQAEEIAEVVAGVLADALGAQFENTPARGGVA